MDVLSNGKVELSSKPEQSSPTIPLCEELNLNLFLLSALKTLQILFIACELSNWTCLLIYDVGIILRQDKL